MRNEKPNCIGRAARRKPLTLGVLLALLLAVFPLATPGLAAGESGVVPQASLANKPEITIQGNLVVDDSGAPTGFYELALCVRSPKRIVDVKGQTPDPATPDKTVEPGTEITETAYNAYLAAHSGAEGDFTVTYYPFAAASAVVEVNADVLTAVDWDVEQVTYDAWNAETNAYTTKALDDAYPRGIDRDANTDPDVWPTTGPAPFPDITTATLSGLHREPVALDVEGDRSTFTATAQVDDYLQTSTAKTALVTLSAHAPDNKPVIYTQSTPVAVVRFSYDLQRFPKNTVMVSASGVTGTASDQGFWLGLDRGHNNTVTNGKTPLTWLANTALGSGGSNYDYSDARAASTGAGQVVWTKISSRDTDGAPVADWDSTEYYYYLGAENPAGTGAEGSVPVVLPGADAPTTVDHVWVPKTASQVKVLAPGTAENPKPGPGDGWTQAQYSYYSNIIKLNDGLRLELVNAPTFRPKTGTGTGGNQILFYDWDDTLIGSLIVGDGDVRQEVNKYVETNFIHPDLRAGQYLENGEIPTDPTALANYQNVVDSLNREYTYRGSKYPYRLNGGDSLKTENGDKYPLTNKLDYAFYRRLNLVNTLVVPDPADPLVPEKARVENYYTVAPVSEDAEAGKYPYVYGWAVVEDPANQAIETAGENWALRLDSVRTEGTWTTFDSGELGGLEPSYTDKGYPAKPIPAGTTPSQPGGLAGPMTSGGNYDYMTSSADASGYLRFADFSDMDAMLKDGQDVLIVKAVYEPGTDLLQYDNYTTVEGSLYTVRYSTNASTGNAVYSIQYQYQRANNTYGDWQGVRRIREPAVETGYTYDINEFDDPELGIDQDLAGNRAFQMKTVADNSDIMDIDLLTGGVIWKVDYILVDLYGGLNVATGNLRSTGGELDLKTGFNYVKAGGDERLYEERQGTDSLIVDSTITHILTEATKIARGESSDTLSKYFSLSTIQDLNLKVDMQGTEFTALNYALCATYTQALVNAIVAAYPDPATAPAGLYDQRGAVTLTWHQLQRHIIMAGAGNAAGIFAGGSLTSDGVCAGFPWCRYDGCSSDVKMEINNLGDLMTALNAVETLDPGDNTYKKAKEALDGLTGAQLMGYGFRTSPEGVPYDAAAGDPTLKDTILDDLKQARSALAASTADWSGVTWRQVQEEILRSRGADPTGADLWWEPKEGAPQGTPPKIQSWEDLWNYSIYAALGVGGDGTKKVPDAFDGFDQAALDALVSGQPRSPAGANVGWFRTGEIDPDASDHAMEFTLAEFSEKWAAALAALTAPTGPYTAETVQSAPWEEIQYALIHGTYKSFADILKDPAEDYWWKGGGKPSLTFEKLLEAVNEFYFSGNSATLDDLLAAGIGPVNDEVYLRKDDTGAAFASVQEFKNLLTAALDNLRDLVPNKNAFMADGKLDPAKVDRWVMQYLMIHYNGFDGLSDLPESGTIQGDAVNNDYWWFDGGAPTRAMPLRSVKELANAYFWSEAGNEHALDELSVETMKSLGLRADGVGSDWPAGLDGAALKARLKAAMELLPYGQANLNDLDETTLARELQYALAEGRYASGATLAPYWWQEGDKSYPAIQDPAGDRAKSQANLLKAAWQTWVGNQEGCFVPEAEGALRALSMDFINKRQDGLALRRTEDGDEFRAATFLERLQAAVELLGENIEYSELETVTQYQLQYFLLDASTYKTDDAVKAEVLPEPEEDPVGKYWWFVQDTKPGGSGPVWTPVDPGEWKQFSDAFGEYIANYDGTALESYLGGDVSKVNDVLKLRNPSGEKFGSLEEFFDGTASSDLIFRVGDMLALSDRAADVFDDSWNVIGEFTWEDVQYAIFHLEELKDSHAMPDQGTVESAMHSECDWMLEGGASEEQWAPIDPEEWRQFSDAFGDYAANYDGSSLQSYLGSDVSKINDVLMLRNSSGEKFGSVAEFFDGTASSDLIFRVGDVLAQSNRCEELFDEDWNVIGEFTWEDIQYTIMHLDELEISYTLPDYDTVEAEAKANYRWRYTSGIALHVGARVTQIPHLGLRSGPGAIALPVNGKIYARAA